MITIGHYVLSSPVVLAPMAGVTDRPFRELCRRFGAGLAVSEMLTSDSSLWHSRKSRLRMDHCDETAPISVQIAGSDPQQMAEAARLNVDHGAQIIDINMGCPAKKVCKRAAGSALLRDEKLVAAILEAVVKAVSVPVTLKIRTGWSPEERNAVRIARIAEQSGAQLLAVHGRTRACRFEGDVEYDTIAAVKAAISIPVLANGDIDSPEKARAVLDHTRADGVMIGRAAQGQPWLCTQIAHYLQHGTYAAAPSQQLQQQVMRDHLQQLHEFYGEPMGARIARKHVGWYLAHQPEAAVFQRQFNQLETAAEQHRVLNQWFARLTTDEEQAA
ncbi:MAG: tRNA dihydrouridine synthase DusB [Verrucomicrobiaceae bacterium]|nr:tRNA dihydrouridine synthase DusB [Verrucomicrobiaceae bacterium]